MKNQRDRAKAKVEFRIHLLTYVVVIGLLMAINLLNSPENLWFIWPMFGWGIGILVHAINVHYSSDGSSIKDRMIEKEMKNS